MMKQAEFVGKYRILELVGEGSFGKVGPARGSRPCRGRGACSAQSVAMPPDHDPHVPLSRAQVFKARKAGSLATVAVKLITKRGKNDKDLLGLRQEIDILRHLRHNHIIQMLDAFETSTDFCVVTEFAQGTLF